VSQSSNVKVEEEKIVQLPTPKTPRHRDALSKRVPITPRHRIGLIGKQSTPSAPRTPSTSNNVTTVYHCARQLFTRSADPGPFIGREDQREALRDFVEGGVLSKSGRCLYVSGPPGTGKSALVSEVCRNVQHLGGFKAAHINCMSVKCSKDIYGKLIEELIGDDMEIEDVMAHMRAVFVPRKKSSNLVYVVTLDEIDHLLTLDLEILYTLFEWSLHKLSRLIIIGIANALDFTDRFLPRLKARNLKPRLLPFLPYTAPEIASVVTIKLKSLSSTDPAVPAEHIPFIHPAAIQLCSKKIASQSGDLRKAFDIIRRTLDLIEIETKQKLLHDLPGQPTPISPSEAVGNENSGLQSPPRAVPTLETSLLKLNPFTAPRATIAHVSRVSATALSNGTSQRLQTLNLQQRAALCSLVSHQKTPRKGTSSIFATPLKMCAALPVRKLFEIYCTLCKRENALHPLTRTEFADIISGLETLGLVGDEEGGSLFSGSSGTPSRKGKGIIQEKRIVCFVDEDEMRRCLSEAGQGILMGMLGCDQ